MQEHTSPLVGVWPPRSASTSSPGPPVRLRSHWSLLPHQRASRLPCLQPSSIFSQPVSAQFFCTYASQGTHYQGQQASSVQDACQLRSHASLWYHGSQKIHQATALKSPQQESKEAFWSCADKQTWQALAAFSCNFLGRPLASCRALSCRALSCLLAQDVTQRRSPGLALRLQGPGQWGGAFWRRWCCLGLF